MDDRRRERRLAVVDVTGRTDVDVRFLPVEFCLSHSLQCLLFRLTRVRTSPSQRFGATPRFRDFAAKLG